MTTRAESLRRCRCDGATRTGAPPWCGRDASQEDGLCDFCREGCNSAMALTIEQTLARDGVEVRQ